MDPDGLISEIVSILQQVGLDESALDPAQKKSLRAMRKMIQRYRKLALIARARRLFKNLQAKEFLEILESGLAQESIADALKDAGMDAAALDPEGKRSAAEMKVELDQAVQDYRREETHQLLSTMEKGELAPRFDNPPAMEERIRLNLEEMKTTLAAFDAAGQKSAENVQAIMERGTALLTAGASFKNPESAEIPLPAGDTHVAIDGIRDVPKQAQSTADRLDTGSPKTAAAIQAPGAAANEINQVNRASARHDDHVAEETRWRDNAVQLAVDPTQASLPAADKEPAAKDAVREAESMPKDSPQAIALAQPAQQTQPIPPTPSAPQMPDVSPAQQAPAETAHPIGHHGHHEHEHHEHHGHPEPPAAHTGAAPESTQHPKEATALSSDEKARLKEKFGIGSKPTTHPIPPPTHPNNSGTNS